MNPSVEANLDHFALFGLPRRQALDLEQLEARYRALQAQAHPDRFAHGSAAEKRRAEQLTARINEAWQTLKDPLRRARYLLELAGHDAGLETNTAMPLEFLQEQMELREAVAEAKASGDAAALEAQQAQLRRAMREAHARLQTLLDAGEFARAGALVRELMFHEKLMQEIGDALEALDN